MKLALRTIEPVFVIDKSKKPWEMNGNKGVVYKVICHKKVEDEVQVEDIRITEEVYNEIEPMQKYHFAATIDVKNNRMEVYHAYPADTAEKDNTVEKGGTATPNMGKASASTKKFTRPNFHAIQKKFTRPNFITKYRNPLWIHITITVPSTVVLSRAGVLRPFIVTLDRTGRADTDTGDRRGLEYRSIAIPSWVPVSPCRKGICSLPNDQLFPLVL